MKKLMLIGKFNGIFEELLKLFQSEGSFNVQMCADNAAIIKGMMGMITPEVVVVSLIGMDSTAPAIMSYLRADHSEIPVICIGKDTELRSVSEYRKLNQFYEVERPVDNNKILELAIQLTSHGGITDNAELTRAGINPVSESNTETAPAVASSAAKSAATVKPAAQAKTNVQANTAVNAKAEVAANASSPAKAAAQSVPGAGKKILLVDDNAFQLRMMNSVLSKDYKVMMATDGFEAIRLIQEDVPDIIFLDYEMPVCDGKLTMEMIRNIDTCSGVPVIFLTGVRDEEVIMNIMRLKPNGYLLKPAKADKIREILEKYLG